MTRPEKVAIRSVALAPKVAALFLIVALGACDSATDPLGHLQMTLAAAPIEVSMGDTVNLLGIAYNPTRSIIFASNGCAPGIGFFVREPNGVSRSLYDGLQFNCPGLDSHSIEPGETDTVSWKWRTPDTAGTYEVRAALFEAGGSLILSATTLVTVE